MGKKEYLIELISKLNKDKNDALQEFLLIEEELSFEEWVKYVPKIHYPCLLGIDNKIRVFIDKHLNYLYKHRFFVVTLEFLLDSIQEFRSTLKITKTEEQELMNSIRKCRFGSMKIDW